MFKKLFESIAKKISFLMEKRRKRIVFLKEKRRLEKILNYVDWRKGPEEERRWYQACVDWHSHTDSPTIILNGTPEANYLEWNMQKKWWLNVWPICAQKRRAEKETAKIRIFLAKENRKASNPNP